MTGIAIAFLILAVVILWGGLIASILFVRARPELESYPSGATEDEREEDAPIIRDT